MKKEKIQTTPETQADYGDSFGNTVEQPQKRGHALRNTLVTLIVLVVLLAIAAVTAINFMLSTDHLTEFDTEPSNKLAYTLAQSVVFGGAQDIPESDINAMLAYVFQQRGIDQQEQTPPSVQMDALAVTLHKDMPSQVYARLSCMGQVLVLSADAQVTLDSTGKQFAVALSNTKIGSLPVPAEWVTKFLFENDSVKQLSDKLTYEGSTVRFPSEITVELMKQEISLELKEFTVNEHSASVLTTSAMEALGEFFNHLFD